MTNTLERAQFWGEFICTRCQFPEPEKLRAQFLCATLSEFCPCGCNSFAVTIPEGMPVAPIATPVTGMKGVRMVFEADFTVGNEMATLEILLFADGDGNLRFIEIDYCANAYPVPNVIEVQEPFHVYASERLLRHDG
jgi:hypothetical protein